MKRGVVAWIIFAASSLLLAAVMLYFTVAMLRFERMSATAGAQAALEENIRLALWRIDSIAAALLQNDQTSARVASNLRSIPLPQSQGDSSDASVQQRISRQEFQQRNLLNTAPSNDWKKVEPALLARIADILPGASLESVAASQDDPNDTRRLASIPARLIVPQSALPVINLPIITPLRITLMIAWACVLLAAAAVAKLLAATLALSERRGAFVSAVTHELRTPITTCRMYSEMLASGMISDPQQRKEYLDTLVIESDRLGHLVENVLAYSRIEQRIPPNRAASINVVELMDQILPALRRRAEQAKLRLYVFLPEKIGRACKTDAIAVQQILLNLVDNACKYGRSEIELRLQFQAEYVEFRVIDTGPGISNERMSHLFDAFNKSSRDTNPGIGLGLHLSLRFARELGGDLQHVPSKSGATMLLRLPLD